MYSVHMVSSVYNVYIVCHAAITAYRWRERKGWKGTPLSLEKCEQHQLSREIIHWICEEAEQA